MPYATAQDVYNIFGQSNVDKWANIDNLDDGLAATALITARLEWALDLATSMINDELIDSDYDVPFEQVEGAYPLQIIDACARQAGVLLYEGRGIVDAEDDGQGIHALKPHADKVRALLLRIKAGKIILTGWDRISNIPHNVVDETIITRQYNDPVIGPPYWEGQE